MIANNIQRIVARFLFMDFPFVVTEAICALRTPIAFSRKNQELHPLRSSSVNTEPLSMLLGGEIIGNERFGNLQIFGL